MVQGAAPTTTVLVLVKGLGMGGAERLLVDQVVGGAPGIRYVVAYVRPDKTHFVAALTEAGIETVPLRRAGDRRPWPLALAGLLRSLRPDIVHSHSPLPASVARVLVRTGFAGRHRHHVTTEHNRWDSHRRPTRVANAATLALDAATWAVSDETRASISPAWLQRRVVTLHHGVDIERVRTAGKVPPERAPARGEGDFVFIQVANRRPNKAHEVMLAAIELAAAKEPRIGLWLIGQWLDTEEFSQLVERNAAADHIHVLGARPDALGLIARADALILSSDHEGLPVAIMEAFALGRPVVSTSVGGVPEAVRDGVEGLLVPPRDPAALADAMVRLAQDPALEERLASGAEDRASAFDARHAQDIQAATYRRLAAAEVQPSPSPSPPPAPPLP